MAAVRGSHIVPGGGGGGYHSTLRVGCGICRLLFYLCSPQLKCILTNNIEPIDIYRIVNVRMTGPLYYFHHTQRQRLSIYIEPKKKTLPGFALEWCKKLDRLSLWPPNYLMGIFTHLKLCLADAIHNVKWVEIIHIWQLFVHYFQIYWLISGWLSLNLTKMW